MIELDDEPMLATDRQWPFSVSVIIPARNESHAIGTVVRGVLEQCPDAEVIVVDDASTDDTPMQAELAGARVIRRPYNIGNGAGVKTGVRAATGDVVVVVDADGQHNPADIGRLLQYIGAYDMVIGARDRTGQQNTFRWLGNSLLNWLGSYVAGMPMEDLTSGFRVMRRSIMLEFVSLLPNQFFFAIWAGPIMIQASALSLGGAWTPFTPIAKGNWGPVLLMAVASLLTGIWWEFWNNWSAPSNPHFWQYDVPFVNVLHVFEMPLLGYLGYLPFGVGVWVWWLTMARLTRFPAQITPDAHDA